MSTIVRCTAVVLFCALSLGFGGCKHNQDDKASLPAAGTTPRLTVRVTKPATTLSAGAAKVTGQVRSRNEATLSASITAQILNISVDVGSRVKPGQRLVVLDSRTLQAQLENARAASRLAEANLTAVTRELHRAESLVAQGALAEASLDQAKTAREVATAQSGQAAAAVQGAQQLVRNCLITAPFGGVVTSRLRNVGDSVSAMPPTPILTVTDLEHLEVRVMVPEGLIGLVREGETFSALANPNNTPLKARTRVLGSTIDSATRTIEVLADIVEPLDGSLRPGVIVTAQLGTPEGLTGPFLPAAAVRGEGASRYVWAVQADRLLRKDVSVASVSPGTLWVKQGLLPTDVVALGALDHVQPGTTVTVLAE